MTTQEHHPVLGDYRAMAHRYHPPDDGMRASTITTTAPMASEDVRKSKTTNENTMMVKGSRRTPQNNGPFVLQDVPIKIGGLLMPQEGVWIDPMSARSQISYAFAERAGLPLNVHSIPAQGVRVLIAHDIHVAVAGKTTLQAALVMPDSSSQADVILGNTWAHDVQLEVFHDQMYVVIDTAQGRGRISIKLISEPAEPKRSPTRAQSLDGILHAAALNPPPPKSKLSSFLTSSALTRTQGSPLLQSRLESLLLSSSSRSEPTHSPVPPRKRQTPMEPPILSKPSLSSSSVSSSTSTLVLSTVSSDTEVPHTTSQSSTTISGKNTTPPSIEPIPISAGVTLANIKRSYSQPVVSSLLDSYLRDSAISSSHSSPLQNVSSLSRSDTPTAPAKVQVPSFVQHHAALSSSLERLAHSFENWQVVNVEEPQEESSFLTGPLTTIHKKDGDASSTSDSLKSCGFDPKYNDLDDSESDVSGMSYQPVTTLFDHRNSSQQDRLMMSYNPFANLKRPNLDRPAGFTVRQGSPRMTSSPSSTPVPQENVTPAPAPPKPLILPYQSLAQWGPAHAVAQRRAAASSGASTPTPRQSMESLHEARNEVESSATLSRRQTRGRTMTPQPSHTPEPTLKRSGTFGGTSMLLRSPSANGNRSMSSLSRSESPQPMSRVIGSRKSMNLTSASAFISGEASSLHDDLGEELIDGRRSSFHIDSLPSRRHPQRTSSLLVTASSSSSSSSTTPAPRGLKKFGFELLRMMEGTSSVPIR